MENKSYLKLKILHLILMAIALVLSVFIIVKTCDFTTIYGVLALLFSFVRLIALIFGLVYIFNGFKKDVSNFYKGYMLLYVVSMFLFSTNSIATKDVSYFEAFLNNGALVASLVLAIGKDLGKKNTYIAAIALLLCTLVPLIIYGFTFTNYGNEGLIFLGCAISNFLLAVTATFMVYEKYTDKVARGRKV